MSYLAPYNLKLKVRPRVYERVNWFRKPFIILKLTNDYIATVSGIHKTIFSSIQNIEILFWLSPFIIRSKV